jgi:maltooligosyltrehalose trehalohydrolase
VSHSDPDLIEAVRRGRRAEFASFGWDGDPPDPQAEETFHSARLNPGLRLSPGPHRHLWEFHRRLIALRRGSPVFASSDASHLEVSRVGSRRIGCIRRWCDREEAVIVFHIGEEPVQAPVSLAEGHWEKMLDSAEAQWGGPGSAVPGTLVSESEVLMELSPYAFLVLFKADSER